ncbi:hypothetical protein A606_06055 [Corynebacterium terpenotabidum Y-11]|uniref:Capsule synthesis protein CapA domain-containing protein n=2 Tax=Corynebacterium terpenotabidum TaxID=89154 RepID=S4XJW4_9CORY|nr:hypothetical protein A606_06055 [Corynebacterium terpenotabidum Y-11]
MAFGGDVMFESHLASLATDPNSLVELRDTLGAADLSVVNLETSITDRGTPFPGKAFTFRAPESALVSLQNAGVDAVTMAANHAFDYGEEGAVDTLAAKDASPIPVAGIGRDIDEAFTPVTLEANGVKIALVNASEVYEETLEYNSAGVDKYGIASAVPRDRLLREVRDAKKDHDVVVVSMHWGIEAAHCPGEQAIATSEALEDAGADLIVGGHQHRLNGQGWLGNAYVNYGMGNFIYYLNAGEAGHTGVLTVTFDIPASDAPVAEQNARRVSDADWQPMLIGYDGIPRPVDDATAAELTSLSDSYRTCIPVTAAPEETA